MPVLTHEQLHQLLAGLASLQKLDGDALHAAAGIGDPTDARELLACMILARTTPHSQQSAARNHEWELAQVRRLFP